MICERILRERENELREEYERILHTKLADQYEQFVKFTYDQLHRSRPASEAPSCKHKLIIYKFISLKICVEKLYLLISIVNY